MPDPSVGDPADVIELRGLRFVAICGALPEERDRPQPIEVDLSVEADLSVAGRSDALADTVHYGALCDAVSRVVTGGEPELLEFLAEQVASAVLAVDDRCQAVTVGIRKLRPPVPHALGSAGVQIRRTA